MKNQLIGFVWWLLMVGVSHATVVVERIDEKNKIATIKIINKIHYGEEEELSRELNTLSKQGYKLKLNAIQLDTKGGNRYSAMAMGRLIRERNLNTFVSKTSHCGSACIYVASGGIIRMIYGTVTVHRSSYGEEISLMKVESLMAASDQKTVKHIKDMGLSILLTDAILMTPHWAYRELTEQELRRWGVNATERLFEEMWFRRTAINSKKSLETVRDIFDENVSVCSQAPKRFEMTQWDCVELAVKK